MKSILLCWFEMSWAPRSSCPRWSDVIRQGSELERGMQNENSRRLALRTVTAVGV